MLDRLKAMTGGRTVRRFSGDEEGEAPPEGAPLGGTRAEAMQRLQVGLFGLGSMVLLQAAPLPLGTNTPADARTAAPPGARVEYCT